MRELAQTCLTCSRFSRWCEREEAYECELDTDDVLECVTHQQSKWIPHKKGEVSMATAKGSGGDGKPLGVLTQKRWIEQRVQELTRALTEYAAADKYQDIRHWVLELDEHLEELELMEEESL